MIFGNNIAIGTIRSFLLTLGLTGYGTYLYLIHVYAEDMRVRQVEIDGLTAEIDYLEDALKNLPSGLAKTRSERHYELDRLRAQMERKEVELDKHKDVKPWFKTLEAFWLFAFSGLCVVVPLFGMVRDELKADRDKKRVAKTPRKHNRPTRKRNPKA